MTVPDDLATLRQSVRFSNAQPRLSVSWESNAALDRVEAEIARLERLNTELTRDFNAMLVEQSKQRNRAEAAEAALADTRRALGEIKELCDHWSLHDATDPDEHERWRNAAIARAELIGKHARRALAAGDKP